MTDLLNPLFFQQNVNAITSIKMCVQTHTPFHTNYNAFMSITSLRSYRTNNPGKSLCGDSYRIWFAPVCIKSDSIISKCKRKAVFLEKCKLRTKKAFSMFQKIL